MGQIDPLQLKDWETNFATLLVHLERQDEIEGLHQALQPLKRLLEGQEGLQKAFFAYLQNVVLAKFAPDATVLEAVKNLEELDAMITEEKRTWKERMRMEGAQQGRQEGEAAALKKLLARRFGEMASDRVTALIDKADLAQIEAWFDRAIDATSIEDVFDTHR
ncbi:hypothetical protein OX89_12430 [Diaphorobacter sp. J5-51]|nr:hypothetical protein OX89_12430 [Diaphorobacter sp. J5-51]